MIIGFSGTQEGMNGFQKTNLRRYLDEHSVGNVGVHGVCIGADLEFHQELRIRGIPIIGRPSNIPNKMAQLPAEDFEILYPVDDPLTRNRKIVRESDLMIIAPAGPERLRSGTWMTYRYTQTLKKPMLFLWWKLFS